MQDSRVEKAKIYKICPRTGKSELWIQCLFNPKEYSFSKTNKWSFGTTSGINVPSVEFGGGEPAVLTVQLFFDTYSKNEDVRIYTDRIWSLLHVDPDTRNAETGKSEPPHVRFQWGDTWSFEAVIKSVKQKFTLFKENGCPVRAVLDVTFQQVVDEALLPPQNPTSGGRHSDRLWVVHQGDTLPLIAFECYGRADRWPQIADANNLEEVRQLKPGTELRIPNV